MKNEEIFSYIVLAILGFLVGTAILPQKIDVSLGAVPVLPNPMLTPGDTVNIDLKTLCTPGYTSTVRNVPQSEKDEVLKEYGLDPKNHPVLEIDHLVSLELGGSNDIKNLWPEIGSVPNAKDKVENYLHRRVCSGQINLEEAQKEIRTNWTKVIIK